MDKLQCKKCGSWNTKKNGFRKSGRQKYHCHDCGVYSTTEAGGRDWEALYGQIEQLYHEGISQRGISRVTGVSRPTITAHLKKTFRPIGETLAPARERPELELDELWSYVTRKGEQVWVWVALERLSRRIVGLAFGDRSAETCRALWNSLPADYRKRAICYTDEYEPYRLVLPSQRHRPMPKSSGATSLVDRFNLTLRNWCANLNRKTLAVSQSVALHCTRIRLVINHYNSLHAGLW